MKDNAVIIMAHRRQAFLSVCLTGIFRCTGSTRWDIFVDVDGPRVDEAAYKREVGPYADSCKWLFRPGRLHNMRHAAEVFGFVGTHGYDRILFLEEDMLLRKDALTYAVKVPVVGRIQTLYKDPAGLPHHYISNSGNVFDPAICKAFSDFIQSGEYIGSPYLLEEGRTIPWNVAVYDIPMFTLCRKLGIHSNPAPKQYALNFGLTGMNHPDPEFASRLGSLEPKDRLNWVVRNVDVSQTRTPGFEFV